MRISLLQSMCYKVDSQKKVIGNVELENSRIGLHEEVRVLRNRKEILSLCLKDQTITFLQVAQCLSSKSLFKMTPLNWSSILIWMQSIANIHHWLSAALKLPVILKPSSLSWSMRL